jgi:hypothetical protein
VIRVLEDLVTCNKERIKDVVAGHELPQDHQLSLDNTPQWTMNHDGSVDFKAKISRFKIKESRGNDGFQEEGEAFAGYGLPNERASANHHLSIRMQRNSGPKLSSSGQ